MPKKKSDEFEFKFATVKSVPIKSITELEGYLQLSLLKILEQAFIAEGRGDFGEFCGKCCSVVDLKKLLMAGVLAISSNNSAKLYKREGEFIKVKDVCKLNYYLNVSLDEHVIEIVNHEYFRRNNSSVDVTLLLKMLAKLDLVNQLRRYLEIRGLELEETEEGGRQIFDNLNKYSYTVLLHICEKVARYYSDQVLIKKMTKQEVASSALLKVAQFLERNERAGYDMFEGRLDSCGETLRFFVTKILGLPLDILRDPINESHYNKWLEYDEFKRFERQYLDQFK